MVVIMVDSVTETRRQEGRAELIQRGHSRIQENESQFTHQLWDLYFSFLSPPARGGGAFLIFLA